MKFLNCRFEMQQTAANTGPRRDFRIGEFLNRLIRLIIRNRLRMPPGFYLMLKDSAGVQTALENPYDFYEQIRVSGQQFMGVTDATMTHGEAWHFWRLGSQLERADKTSRMLDVKYFILLRSVEDVRMFANEADVVHEPYPVSWPDLFRPSTSLGRDT